MSLGLTRSKKLLYASIYRMRLLKHLILPIFLLAFLQVSAPVSAQQFNTSSLKRVATTTAEIKASGSAVRQARKDALSDLKVKACDARQAIITKRSEQLVKRAISQQEVFAKISQRVQDFYQTKLLPQGKIVANYDVLVADVATKSVGISPLLAQAQTDATSFSCDKDRPADQVLTFNKDMKAVMVALEAYRKSVRTLIVAVKSVVGESKSATDSAMPITQ